MYYLLKCWHLRQYNKSFKCNLDCIIHNKIIYINYLTENFSFKKKCKILTLENSAKPLICNVSAIESMLAS